MNKKGIAAATIGELIIVIAGGIVVLWVVLGIMGYLSPTSASVGCGLNLRVAAATLSSSTLNAGAAGSFTFLGAPILMCNQYQNPVDINAANFNSCSGISDFCKRAKGDALVECWKQCARIQIDQLTNICWTMAGSGTLNFKNTAFQDAKLVSRDPVILTIVVAEGTLGYMLAGPVGAKLATGATLTYAIGHEGKAKILRCFRFRIVNPVIGPDRKTIVYSDDSLGHSWLYGFDLSKACVLTEGSSSCSYGSYGGVGVSYINTLSTGTSYTISGNKVSLPTNKDELDLGGHLNYNISDPRNQVCYIAYYQGGDGKKFTMRSCKSWSEYAGNAIYMN